MKRFFGRIRLVLQVEVEQRFQRYLQSLVVFIGLLWLLVMVVATFLILMALLLFNKVMRLLLSPLVLLVILVLAVALCWWLNWNPFLSLF